MLLGGAGAPSANPAPSPGGAGWKHYPSLSYSQRRGKDASLARQAHDDSAPLKGFQTTCAETKRTPCSPMSPAQTPPRHAELATRPVVIYAKNVCLTADTAAGIRLELPDVDRGAQPVFTGAGDLETSVGASTYSYDQLPTMEVHL